MDPIALGFTVRDEPASQVLSCLRHLRSSYPMSPVVIIRDGLKNTEIDSLAAKYGWPITLIVHI
jgi:hypothetical protein